MSTRQSFFREHHGKGVHEAMNRPLKVKGCPLTTPWGSWSCLRLLEDPLSCWWRNRHRRPPPALQVAATFAPSRATSRRSLLAWHGASAARSQEVPPRDQIAKIGWSKQVGPSGGLFFLLPMVKSPSGEFSFSRFLKQIQVVRVSSQGLFQAVSTHKSVG